MAISLTSIKNWLANNAAKLTPEDIRELEALLANLRGQVEEHAARKKALLADLAALDGISVEQAEQRYKSGEGKKVAENRRVYMDPFEPFKTPVGLFPGRMPEWATKLLEDPNPTARWTKAELKVDEIEAAFERHTGEKWVDRYSKSAAEILADELKKDKVRYTRPQNRKKGK